ncbi:MAG: hypothetical protein NDJ89_14815 [Oligoflexia bacterium]|nr:hypothetical protein [Oligoflexia bacterium]
MRSISLVLLALTVCSTAMAADQSTLIRSLVMELPEGRHVGVAGGKQSCAVDVDLLKTGANEITYRVVINKPSSTKTPPQFELRQNDQLNPVYQPNHQVYVGNPQGIAGIRTWVTVARPAGQVIKSDLQVLVASDGDWIIRVGGAGLPTCKIKALR